MKRPKESSLHSIGQFGNAQVFQCPQNEGLMPSDEQLAEFFTSSNNSPTNAGALLENRNDVDDFSLRDEIMKNLWKAGYRRPI